MGWRTINNSISPSTRHPTTTRHAGGFIRPGSSMYGTCCRSGRSKSPVFQRTRGKIWEWDKVKEKKKRRKPRFRSKKSSDSGQKIAGMKAYGTHGHFIWLPSLESYPHWTENSPSKLAIGQEFGHFIWTNHWFSGTMLVAEGNPYETTARSMRFGVRTLSPN